MNPRSSYKRTFFDRHGAEGGNRLKLYGHAIMVFGTVIGAAFLAGTLAGINMFGLVPLSLTLLGALTLSGMVILVGLRSGSVMESAAMYLAEGSSTPYEEQFSEEQALVMQSRFTEALESFEHRMAMNPGEPRVRIAAADLYATHGKDPKRAAELYREVQKIPNLKSGHDIYVANKLADLYLGPLNSPGKALVEFRKLESRYPGTVHAKNAVLAIKNLKPQIVRGAEAPPPDVWEQAQSEAGRKPTPPDTPGMPGY